jgi:1-acyl-sn-glycerol-3-phosphate acyltransferase
LGRIYLPVFFRIEAIGLENIPRDCGVVIVAKHQRWEDIPLLAAALPLELYYVAKSELFTTTLGRRLIGGLGGIPLNRDRPMESRNSLRTIGRILEKGSGLVVFPEGTYFRGKMGPGREGVVRFISSRFGVPFLPVGMEYKNNLWRGRVVIRVGKAFFRTEELPSELFLTKAMAEIERLSGL